MTKLMIKEKKCWLVIFLLAFYHYSSAQTENKLSLDECYQLARANYPAIKKLDLIAKTNEFTIQNANKKYIPHVSFSGQAIYQSQTINFSDAIGIPGNAGVLPVLSKDQYKIQGEIDQLIYDGGSTGIEKDLSKANAELQKQNVEVTLYSINSRINTLFFSILLMDAQLSQNKLNQANLRSQLQKTQVQFKNGTAFKSNAEEIEAEILNIDMANTEYESNRTAYINMLSLFIGRKLPPSTPFILPQSLSMDENIKRPELRVYDLQKSVYDLQEKQLKPAYLPKFNAFFQGAYGRPTLNIIENQFGPWYVTGVKFSWSLGSLYSLKNKKNLVNLNRQSVDVDREAFLFNTKLDLSQQDEQVKKYSDLITQDEKVIAIRQSVTKSAQAQLANGVITTHEYIQKVNASNLAQQTLILHQIQLVQAKYNQKFISGN